MRIGLAIARADYPAATPPLKPNTPFRDPFMGEDASRISAPKGAYVAATLRNLLLGLFELQKHRDQTQAHTFPGWRRKLTQTHKIQLLIRKTSSADNTPIRPLPQVALQEPRLPSRPAADG